MFFILPMVSLKRKKNVTMNISTTFAFCWQSCNITLMNAQHSLVFVAVDFIAAMLIRSTGRSLQMARNRSLKSLDLTKSVNNSGESYYLMLYLRCALLNLELLVGCTCKSTYLRYIKLKAQNYFLQKKGQSYRHHSLLILPSTNDHNAFEFFILVTYKLQKRTFRDVLFVNYSLRSQI